MAEKQTLARPYAEAAFALAKERNELKKWSETLAFIAVVAADERVRQLAGNPRVDRASFLDLVLGICSDVQGSTSVAGDRKSGATKQVDDQGANFVRLLVENRRLDLVSDIQCQYESLKADAEARVEATVISALPLEAAQLKTISEALKRKLGREVNLTAQTDKALMGGVVIHAGDLVIDGSVRGRLAELAIHLSH
jgi:F-type H+-transporting ATPase subunit delta